MKAFIAEPGRDQVFELLERAEPAATSRLSYVECRAAFARAGRDGRLTPAQVAAVTRSMEERWAELVVVEFNEARMERAGTLAQEHSLRAGDSIHLASALQAAQDAPGGTALASWDVRLWKAASDLGFAMVPRGLPN